MCTQCTRSLAQYKIPPASIECPYLPNSPPSLTASFEVLRGGVSSRRFLCRKPEAWVWAAMNTCTDGIALFVISPTAGALGAAVTLYPLTVSLSAGMIVTQVDEQMVPGRGLQDCRFQHWQQRYVLFCPGPDCPQSSCGPCCCVRLSGCYWRDRPFRFHP